MYSWSTSSLSPSTPVTVLIAAPAPKAQKLYAGLSGDERLHVQAMAESADELAAKLSLAPNTLVLDGLLYEGPDEIASVLGTYAGQAVVLLPQGVDSSAVETIERLSCVSGVMMGEVNMAALTERLLGERVSVSGMLADAVPNSASQPVPASAPLPSFRSTTSGWRAIAVWNLQGGVGKSTVATALALEAASRRLPTLLVGLGAPDPLPLSLGLRPEPNIQTWRSTPTVDGLREAVQAQHGVDLLAGFPSALDLSTYLPDAMEGPASLSRLAGTAAYAGYAVVVLDVSAPELAAAALSAANSLVLVGLATLPGILATVEAVQLASKTLRVGPVDGSTDAVQLVLNRVRRTTFSPEEVVQNGRKLLTDFPTLASVIQDDPEIEESLDSRRPAFFHSDTLRQAARTLADRFFASPAQESIQRESQVGQSSKVYSLGPIRVRV